MLVCRLCAKHRLTPKMGNTHMHENLFSPSSLTAILRRSKYIWSIVNIVKIIIKLNETCCTYLCFKNKRVIVGPKWRHEVAPQWDLFLIRYKLSYHPRQLWGCNNPQRGQWGPLYTRAWSEMKWRWQSLTSIVVSPKYVPLSLHTLVKVFHGSPDIALGSDAKQKAWTIN